MRRSFKSTLTQKGMSELSFFKRFSYKIRDIIKPTIHPKINFFSRLEKQIIFYIILFLVVATSIFMVLEFGYVEII